MEMNLEKYNQKRNFERTLEPEGETAESGEAADSSKHLRFVVQHHIARRDHYDFRLEWNGALLSWAVPKGPSYNTRDKRLAIQVEEHPLEYRNFEGTIPKGEYGGGAVMLWDEGTWEPYADVNEGLGIGSLKFVLKGRRLKGKWALVRLKAKAGETKNNWLLIKEKDQYAKTTDEMADSGISDFTTSIRTGRTMTEIESGIESGDDEKITRNPFNDTSAQLAKPVNKVPVGEDWLYELKYDGYRVLAYLEERSVRLITRNGKDYTKHFQDIASSLIDWASDRAMVLDGEMAVTDAAGKTDFQALQNHMKNPESKNLTYIIFDLLALDGVDLRDRHLIDRKETLEMLLKDAPKNLCYSKHIRGNGEESLLAACNMNLEGIVGKKADSVYSGTRNGDWIKIKCDKRQEFVIGGYTLSDKRTRAISSLLLGVYEGEEFVYAGRAGTGLSERIAQELEEKFQNLKRTESPFKLEPKPKANEKITWIKPELIAEIKFSEWTEENLLRQASFKGLRADKDPMEIKGVKISNPDKVIFEDPEITKLDVIRYYAQVAERILPYVSHRILSVVRCPNGISGSCFFKKHPSPSSKNKGIVTIPIANSSGEEKDYFYIENVSGLISEAQMGTLEFHTWGSCANDLEKPDIMVFDLDPDEGMDLNTVRQGVKDLKSILVELSLSSYLKTSGGKGYHIVVPFTPSVSWDTFHDFAKRIAEVMEQKWPDRYTSNVRKAKRTNKIFIDWIRNGRGATSIAPYSIRARNGARVSMPIGWDELDTVAPDGIHMDDALVRISGDDPWKDFFRNNQLLK